MCSARRPMLPRAFWKVEQVSSFAKNELTPHVGKTTRHARPSPSAYSRHLVPFSFLLDLDRQSMTTSMAEDEEKLCRYCFDGEDEGPLISPCNCRGDQKWVHLQCLRRWQRMVLVSQPTHPAFYERDPRHYRCNVCKGLFTCEPPTRLELMESFTGPELGALMAPGCIIASHATFSAELMSQMQGMPSFMREHSPYAHWCAGVFLITEVEPLDPTLTVPINSPGALEAVRDRLGDNLMISLQGQRLRLMPGGALTGVAPDELGESLAALTYSEGMRLTLERTPPPGCGDDHVTAINLARQTARPIDETAFVQARDAVLARLPEASAVRVMHYIGGPCSPDEVSHCVVSGGTGCGSLSTTDYD